jgi:hypothetical protein
MERELRGAVPKDSTGSGQVSRGRFMISPNWEDRQIFLLPC